VYVIADTDVKVELQGYEIMENPGSKDGWQIMARRADIQKFIALKPCFHMLCDEGHRL
jgi:hypothetical protein